jgi:hypothetical protein
MILMLTSRKGHTVLRHKFSPASDVYATGRFFKDLLPELDHLDMLCSDPEERITLDIVIENLEDLLKEEVKRELEAVSKHEDQPEATKTAEQVLSPIDHNSPAKSKFMTPLFDEKLRQTPPAGANAAKRNLFGENLGSSPKRK